MIWITGRIVEVPPSFKENNVATLIATLSSIIVAYLLKPELYSTYSLYLIVLVFLFVFTDFDVSPDLHGFHQG